MGTLKRIEEIAKAWKQTVRVEPGRYTNDVTVEYSVWHLKRVKDVKVPVENGEDNTVQSRPQDPMIALEAAKQKLQEERDELEHENKRLRQEMEEKSKQWNMKMQRERNE